MISTTSRRPPPELLSCRHGAERGLNPESPGNLRLGPVPAAEVEVDRVPELLGEIEHVRAMLWARITDAQRHGPTAPRIGSLSPVRCEWRRCQKVSLPKAAGFPITSRSMYWMNRGAVARRCCHSAFDDDETKVSYVRGGYRGSRVSRG